MKKNCKMPKCTKPSHRDTGYCSKHQDKAFDERYEMFRKDRKGK